MITSDSQMLTGHDLDSGSFIPYFCKKSGKVLWFTCNVWMLICVNFVLVLPLKCPPVCTLEQFWTFKQIVLKSYIRCNGKLKMKNLILMQRQSLVFCILFFKILLAVTLKNYKPCYSKLNWSLIMHH